MESDKDTNDSVNINHANCSYCNNPFTEKLWCKECDPRRIIEGWTSGNNDIDKFIKDTIYEAREYTSGKYVEWVPFHHFKNIKQIGVGGFAKVYSAKWTDGKAEYDYYYNRNWIKRKSEPIKVALKRLNESQNMSAEYLDELKMHWEFYKNNYTSLKFYGITKDPETGEFMMVLQLVEQGSLRSVLSSNFNNISWKNKIDNLYMIMYDLRNLHKLGCFHKDFHSGNILFDDISPYISDFGLSGPSDKQQSTDKISGVLSYIAPEVLNGEPYTLSSDIYSFGVIMTEFSSGKPPFHNRKHSTSLALEICNGLRPEFGKGTPEIYKKLAYKCMNANSNQRPTANELYEILDFWNDCIGGRNQEKEKFGHKGKEIKAVFEKADKEIPNISTSYEKDPDAVYTSKTFTFNNLTKPINSSIITSYINEETNEDDQDSRLINLEI